MRNSRTELTSVPLAIRAQHFQKLFEYSFTGVTLLDENLQVIYRSPSATHITGWNTIEISLQKPEQFIHPDDRALLQQAMADTLAQPGEAQTRSFRTQHHNGHYITLNCRFSNLLHDPEIAAIVINFVEVPAEKVKENSEQVPGQQQTDKQRELIAGISCAFRKYDQLTQIYEQIIASLLRFSGGKAASIWMLSMSRQQLVKRASSTKQLSKKTEELAHRVWAQNSFLKDAAGTFAVPLTYHEKFVGALTLDYDPQNEPSGEQEPFWHTLGRQMGMELRHRQTSEQLRLLIDRAPDIICIVGTDRYFKEVNPAMSRLLGYTEAELLARSLDLMVHPDDLKVSQERTKAFLQGGDQTMYFENRFVSKSEKAIWLSWTVTRSAEEEVMFCVGKNISDKKEAEMLLDKAHALARIGGWEVDLVHNTAYWSPITKEIYEVPENFVPSADNWLSFYREGKDRNFIGGKMAEVIATGNPVDIEVEMQTARGNIRWVRAIAEAEFAGGKCVRAYGSFQDIDSRKKAELAAMAALQERDKILESIGDGFFAVDRNWIVNFWNAAAERFTGMSQEEMLGQYFWDKFPGATELEFYRQYNQAMETGIAVHFEDYYPLLDSWFCVSAYPSESVLSVFFSNITESKRSAEALAESEKRYSDLFQLSPEPLFVYEMSSLQFLDVNLAAIQHYGYTRDEFLSMTTSGILPDKDTRPLQKGISRHRKKNGEIINVAIHSNKITYHGLPCEVVLAHDVTERVRYVEAVEVQNEKLREISWMQSHVIRAPLSRIMGLLPMLKCPSEEPEQQQIYDFLVSSANELDEQIHNITDVTKVVPIK